jgi:hypothetical protein
MGSDVVTILSLPARLDHAWNLTGEGQLPETNAAQSELTDEAAGTSAAETTVAVTAGKFGLLAFRLGRQNGFFEFAILRSFGSSGHAFSSL